ncbi:MAG: SDR family NAD(P)-dependent oxidoreductase [Rickettsiales bacterium]
MQTALITGSAKRIGKELAVSLHSKGYSVILHYHTAKSEAEELSQALGCRVVFGNLANADSARFIFDQIEGQVDILINSAAHFQNDTLANFSADTFLKTIMINFNAPIALAREMISRHPSGVIINLLDAWAKEIKPKFLSYSISKNALEKFTKSAAPQLPPGFRMNGLLLGAALIKEQQNADIFKELQNKYPCTVEDICKAVEYVITNTELNGQIIDLTKK